MCFGSGFNSPRSTRVTMSVRIALVGAEMPTFSPFAHDKAVEELDLGAAALDHVLAHRRAVLAAAGPVGLGEAVIVDLFLRRRVAFAGAGQGLRVHVADFVEGVAERLADTDRLAAEPVREMPDRVVLDHVAGDHPGAGRKPVAHHVGDELRPALAPEVLGHHRAVGIADAARGPPWRGRYAAMHLADAEDGVASIADLPAARRTWPGACSSTVIELAIEPNVLPQPTMPAIVSSFMQFCSETTIAAGREVLLDHRRRPGGVVGLHADKGDVDRRLLGELLRLGQVQRARPDGERLDIADMGDPQPVVCIASTFSGQGSMKVTSSPA